MEELVDEVIARLPPAYLQPALYTRDGQLVGSGSPIEVRLGETSPLPPIKMKVTSASGRESNTQAELGGTLRFQLGRFE